MIQTYNAKVILLGDVGVGKTAILNRLVSNTFNLQVSNTAGTCFMRYNCKLGDKRVAMDIWDTAGQERYRSLLVMYYKNSDVIVIVFDVTQQNTFKTVEIWYREITEKCRGNKKIILVGNKYDLKTKMKIKQQEQIQLYRKQKGWDFFYASALNNYNIKQIFNRVAQLIVQDGFQKINKEQDKNFIKIKKYQEKKSKNCC